MDIIVKIQEQSISISPQNVITGKICFVADKICFPDKDWNDFPIVILTWWLKAITNIDKGQFELQFMDGPFSVRGTILAEDILILEFVQRSEKDIMMFSGNGSLQVLKDSIMMAAKQLIDIASNRHWESTDLVELRQALEKTTKLG